MLTRISIKCASDADSERPRVSGRWVHCVLLWSHNYAGQRLLRALWHGGPAAWATHWLAVETTGSAQL